MHEWCLPRVHITCIQDLSHPCLRHGTGRRLDVSRFLVLCVAVRGSLERTLDASRLLRTRTRSTLFLQDIQESYKIYKIYRYAVQDIQICLLKRHLTDFEGCLFWIFEYFCRRTFQGHPIAAKPNSQSFQGSTWCMAQRYWWCPSPGLCVLWVLYLDYEFHWSIALVWVFVDEKCTKMEWWFITRWWDTSVTRRRWMKGPWASPRSFQATPLCSSGFLGWPPSVLWQSEMREMRYLVYHFCRLHIYFCRQFVFLVDQIAIMNAAMLVASGLGVQTCTLPKYHPRFFTNTHYMPIASWTTNTLATSNTNQ